MDVYTHTPCNLLLVHTIHKHALSHTHKHTRVRVRTRAHTRIYTHTHTHANKHLYTGENAEGAGEASFQHDCTPCGAREVRGLFGPFFFRGG